MNFAPNKKAPAEGPLHRKNPGQATSPIKVGNIVFGGPEAVLIAGPCAIESYEQVSQVGHTLTQLGIPCLRGGVFKPRTSPYSFQGLGAEGLLLLRRIREEMGLTLITEVMSIDQIALMSSVIDCYQVGSRNMQNFDLLKALGQQDKPVLLKRGLSATLEEFLLAAEYIMAEGNTNVILCERGIRSFDPKTRNVLDLGAVALLKELTHLPVIVDPSHATGKRSLVIPTAKAAIAVGADGIMIEAHPTPEKSVSDAEQALSLEELAQLVHEVNPILQAMGRQALQVA